MQFLYSKLEQKITFDLGPVVQIYKYKSKQIQIRNS